MGFIASNVNVCNSLFSFFFIGKKWELRLNKSNIVKARLVDCNSNYIRIRIGITRNKRCYNLILITIHLFSNNIIIEP